MRRTVLVFAAALAFSSVRADALTVRDVVELSRAGVGEEILLALIEVDRSVFPIDTQTLKLLKQSGVSERVIVAMVRSGRMPPALAEPGIDVASPVQPEPQVIVVDHHEPQIHIREVPVAVPVYIPVVQRSHRGDSADDSNQGNDRRHPGDGHGAEHKPTKPAEPVYWGWGGKLRPDAWKPQ